jgi:hypothetical protein
MTGTRPKKKAQHAFDWHEARWRSVFARVLRAQCLPRKAHDTSSNVPKRPAVSLPLKRLICYRLIPNHSALIAPPRGLSPPCPLPSRVASGKTDALLKPAQPQLLRPIRPMRSCHGVHAADDARFPGVNGEPPRGPEVNGCFARSDPCSCRGDARRTMRAAPASTVSR